MVTTSRDLREQQIPSPVRGSGYRTVLLIGSTGSGKTTLLRQIIGTQNAKSVFPAVSTAKTTVAETEILCAEGDYYAAVTIRPATEVRQLIGECLLDAATARYEGRSVDRVMRSLVQSADQRFRLGYLLGEAGASDAPQEPYRSLLAQIEKIVDRLPKRLTHEELPERLGGDRDFVRAVDHVCSTALAAIDRVAGGSIVERDETGHATMWAAKTSDRSEFLAALEPFTSNDQRRFGHLLSPLVDGIRVRGPFTTLATREMPYLMLVDGEGLGHTVATSNSLPVALAEDFARADRIVLVDNATQPGQAGTAAALHGIASAGYIKKAVFAFTHLDEVVGPNLTSDDAKQNLLLGSLEQIAEEISAEYGTGLRRGLQELLDERVFLLSGLDQAIRSGSSAEGTELARLLKSLATPDKMPPGSSDAVPVISLPDLRDGVAAGATRFLGDWQARLGLADDSGRTPEHWRRVWALNQRLADGDGSGYDGLDPVGDLAAQLLRAIRRTFATSIWWEGRAPTAAEQADLEDRLAQAIAAAVISTAQNRLVRKARSRWNKAYSLTGDGSVGARADMIYGDILLHFVDPDPRGDFVKALVGDLQISAAEAGLAISRKPALGARGLAAPNRKQFRKRRGGADRNATAPHAISEGLVELLQEAEPTAADEQIPATLPYVEDADPSK